MSDATQSAKPANIRIKFDRYRSVEEFKVGFAPLITRSSVFVAAPQDRQVGALVAFRFEIADGTPVLRGEGVVSEVRRGSGGDAKGFVIRFKRLDRPSVQLVEEIVNHSPPVERVMEQPTETPPGTVPSVALHEPEPVADITPPPLGAQPLFESPAAVPETALDVALEPDNLLPDPPADRIPALPRLRLEQLSVSGEVAAVLAEIGTSDPGNGDTEVLGHEAASAFVSMSVKDLASALASKAAALEKVRERLKPAVPSAEPVAEVGVFDDAPSSTRRGIPNARQAPARSSCRSCTSRTFSASGDR